ncbi:MAG: PadR family transcriptional regulator [Candidatus Rokuibacteriota bacterium]|nr:MAG: PadR family transcriptional regulator [Candidatus Rokubacteria bacterium]PYO08654.1 MAG: PadR family transcriptional regulator [Candidatus Rokubacteria bacterium]
MSGYDVKKLIERSIAHFWNESYGQIYPVLNRLAAEGFAARRREKQRGKPDRHVYSLTEKGRGELARWLAVPARYEPFRSELLLKLFLGDAGRAADSIAQIEHYEATQRGLLETYLGIERRLREEMAGHPQLPFSLVTLHYGQHRCRAMLAWCAESSRALKRLEGRRRCRRRR